MDIKGQKQLATPLLTVAANSRDDPLKIKCFWYSMRSGFRSSRADLANVCVCDVFNMMTFFFVDHHTHMCLLNITVQV